MSVVRAVSRDWTRAVSTALVVLLAGIIEALISIHYNQFPNRGTLVPAIVGTAVAIGLGWRRPGVAVGVLWVIAGFQLVVGAPILVTQAAAGVVVFATARWGGTATAMAGAASVPIAGVLAYLGLGAYGTLLVVALFGVCWLAGHSQRRSADRTAEALASQRAAEADAASAYRASQQASEIARLREEQARLARDVHDVVGHSLAVILVLAESAQFIPDSDTAALRTSMANIADLARTSVQDVRQVLAATKPSDTGPGELLSLVEGVRAGGPDIVVDEIGTARTLAPELATAAYRVLQEMLTNAIRHGSRDVPIAIELHWTADTLQIKTVNAVAAEAPAQPDAGGQGLDGMRRRLESVGGRLDIRCQGSGHPGAANFTATAWVPASGLVQ
ncbi:sensor histidine kinase [Nocardia sp. NPDC020380]|uniref:sensor histidine kinase n=1 Tax=Nocardia sp. NPDC020380 TaxID=3364309 RepID=UPI0037A7CE5C